MTVSLFSLGAMLLSMLMLAALPGVSVATVVSQAIAGGWKAALACTAGIILGDLIYLGVAMFGLAWFEQAAGRWTWLLALCGGLYLLWTGAGMVRASPRLRLETVTHTTPLRSAMSGLGITLADQKAILFYLAFLPAFIDLGRVTAVDLVVILAVMTIGVALPKLAYAALAAHLVDRYAGYTTALTRAAGVLLIVVGAVLVGRGVQTLPL